MSYPSPDSKSAIAPNQRAEKSSGIVQGGWELTGLRNDFIKMLRFWFQAKNIRQKRSNRNSNLTSAILRTHSVN